MAPRDTIIQPQTKGALTQNVSGRNQIRQERQESRRQRSQTEIAETICNPYARKALGHNQSLGRNRDLTYVQELRRGRPQTECAPGHKQLPAPRVIAYSSRKDARTEGAQRQSAQAGRHNQLDTGRLHFRDSRPLHRRKADRRRSVTIALMGGREGGIFIFTATIRPRQAVQTRQLIDKGIGDKRHPSK
jgi:hypothetical protein